MMLTQPMAENFADTYMRCLSEGDVDGIVDLYAEDGTVEDPVGSEVISGRDAIREFYVKTVSMKVQAERTGAVRAVANEVVFPFAIHSNVTGTPMTIEIIDHFVLDDHGLVVSMRAFWSVANILQ